MGERGARIPTFPSDLRRSAEAGEGDTKGGVNIEPIEVRCMECRKHFEKDGLRDFVTLANRSDAMDSKCAVNHARNARIIENDSGMTVVNEVAANCCKVLSYRLRFVEFR